jgi:hypothetical protein
MASHSTVITAHTLTRALLAHLQNSRPCSFLADKQKRAKKISKKKKQVGCVCLTVSRILLLSILLCCVYYDAIISRSLFRCEAQSIDGFSCRIFPRLPITGQLLNYFFMITTFCLLYFHHQPSVTRRAIITRATAKHN